MDDTILVKSNFTKIYNDNVWGIGSGTGSLPCNNYDYIRFLQNFILVNKCKSVLDFGCGDWQFSRYIDWTNVSYTGVDVVASVIKNNIDLFSSKNISFLEQDDIDELHNVDLIICKDVLQHLPNKNIINKINSFKMKCKYMLLTNNIYPDAHLNINIPPGACRALRLQDDPFNFKGAVVFNTSFISYGVFVEKHCFLIVGDL